MRNIWMASAALLMTGGVALAQTNSMSNEASSPAPTGAINAPVETQPGQSPGNTAPNNMMPGNQPSSGMSNSAMSSSGMTINDTSGSSGSMMNPTHNWTHHEEMSENAGPRAYLHMAQHAIEHHDKMRAESALGHAETRLLTRSVDAGSSMSMDQSPAVKAIEDARNALSAGDYSTASQDTSNALQQIDSNMSSDNGMSSGSGMSSNNGMSNDNAMSNDGSNDSETGNMAPSVNATSRSGDMSQGGGVTHDSATPSSGNPSGNGMSTGMVNGNGVPPGPSVNSMSRSGQGLGQ